MWIHTMQSIVVHMVDFLRKPLKRTGKAVVTKTGVRAIGEEAKRRLATWNTATHGFQIPKKAQHFVEDLINCGADGNISDFCTIEAKTHQLLMLVRGLAHHAGPDVNDAWRTIDIHCHRCIRIVLYCH
jgi:hypothetical protein